MGRLGVNDSINRQKSGGAERDRTADLFVANEALYQLSYSPKDGYYYEVLSRTQAR